MSQTTAYQELRADNPQPNPPGQANLRPGEEYITPLMMEFARFGAAERIVFLPDECPYCDSSLLDDGAVGEINLVHRYFRGRVFSGGFASDYGDYDDGETHYIQGYECASCRAMLSPTEDQVLSRYAK